MKNKADKLFFKHDANYRWHLMNKVSERCYSPSLFVSVGMGAISLVLAGIFYSSVFDSMINVVVVGIFAVMSAMEYQ